MMLGRTAALTDTGRKRRHNEDVFVGLLGYSRDDLARWRGEGVI